MSKGLTVLPRPGAAVSDDAPRVIKAPSEAAFVGAFGNLLPPASYLSTPHGRAAYYELSPASSPAGPRGGPISRVLFLHGVQTPSIGLQPLATALSARFPNAQHVLLDIWGHGLTDTPFVAHDPPLFHGLIVALMEHLEWDHAHIIGYSFSGSLVATFAAAHPARVASMVLIAPAGLIRAAELFDERQKSYLRGGEGLEEPAQAWILEELEGGPLIVPPDWKERVGRGELVAPAVRAWQLQEHEGHAASIVACFRDGGVLDQHAEFAEAASKGIPSLCVLAELDDICSAQELHDVGLRNTTVVPEAGHGLARENVSQVAQIIEEFWNGLE